MTWIRASIFVRPIWSPAEMDRLPRLEKDLWATGLQPDTNRIADQLVGRDVERAETTASGTEFPSVRPRATAPSASQHSSTI